MSVVIGIQDIEKQLEGKISSNRNRFEEVNGVVFSLEHIDPYVTGYFAERGIEIHELENGLYYSETVMGVADFEDLDYVKFIHKVM